MSEWKKVKVGDICRIVKGTTGIASAEPGEYPLVVTAEERKTCSSYQFDQEAVCIPLVSSSGHGKKSLKNVHYQSGKFALGTILCAVIPNNPEQLDTRFLHQYLQFYKDTILVPLMKGAANVSLSMKDIAAVEIPLPPIEKQRELSSLFITLRENQKNRAAETEKQFEYTKLLRQNILQDAIEGKLTADLPCRQTGWRKHSFKNLSGKLVSEVSDKYFAYVLECDDGSLYKGVTQNLFERINRHLEGRGSEWTAKHIPVSLIYFEEFDTEKEALEREKYFKSGSGREYINEIRNRNKLDYDAEALFEKIQEEKSHGEFANANRLTAISKRKVRSLDRTALAENPCDNEENPFEIPDGWKWVKIGDLGRIFRGSGITRSDMIEKGKPVVRYGELYTTYGLQFSKTISFISDDLFRKSKIFPKNTVIFTLTGENRQDIAKASAYLGDESVAASGDLACWINHNQEPLYLSYFMASRYFLNEKIKIATGDFIIHISAEKLKSVAFPLPPLKEQEEIVTKVENLLAKVTELETQIQERKTLSEKLAFGIIKEKLEG